MERTLPGKQYAVAVERTLPRGQHVIAAERTPPRGQYAVAEEYFISRTLGDPVAVERTLPRDSMQSLRNVPYLRKSMQ